jgi:hypothetical protein
MFYLAVLYDLGEPGCPARQETGTAFDSTT